MNKKTLMIIIIEVIVLKVLYFFSESNYVEMIPGCWIYKNTSILCPACGGTRCVRYFLKGDFIKAFFSNTVFFFGIIYLICVNIVYLINLNREKKILKWVYPKYWYVIIFSVSLLLYTIVRYLL